MYLHKIYIVHERRQFNIHDAQSNSKTFTIEGNIRCQLKYTAHRCCVQVIHSITFGPKLIHIQTLQRLLQEQTKRNLIGWLNATYTIIKALTTCKTYNFDIFVLNQVVHYMYYLATSGDMHRLYLCKQSVNKITVLSR